MKKIVIDYNSPIEYIGDLVLCAGYFDGIHLGHQCLFNQALEINKKTGLIPAAITFDVNPLVVLKVIEKENLITTIDDRVDILEKMGIKVLIVLKFNREISALSPAQFIDFLVKIGVKHLVCGFDYHFGYKGLGNPESVEDLSGGKIKVDIIPKRVYQGQKISSSYIHELLNLGDIEKVNIFLNRKYQVKGRVVKGFNNGTKHGFPTANINLLAPYHLPKSGVYAVEIWIGQIKYIGMANIGVHPTFKKLDSPILEVNIFDYSKDLYGQEIAISFIAFIREEKKFSSIENLYLQLVKDKETALSFFSKQVFKKSN